MLLHKGLLPEVLYHWWVGAIENYSARSRSQEGKCKFSLISLKSLSNNQANDNKIQGYLKTAYPTERKR